MAQELSAGRADDRRFVRLVVLVASVYLALTLLYIARGSRMVGGSRTMGLWDDAWISLRYAQSLADGYGLVWNPGGERIEGFTNPLWVFYMAFLHRLPLSTGGITIATALTGVVMLLTTGLLVAGIARRITGDVAVAAMAMGLTLSNGDLLLWSLYGMEVSLVAAVAYGALALALAGVERGRVSPWFYALIAVAPLIRLDGAIPGLLLIGWLAAVDRPARRRHLALGLGLLAAGLALQTAARLWYYGEPLPNTFYLKVAGTPLYARISRGLIVLVKALLHYQVIWCLAPLAVPALRRDRRIALITALLAVQVAYSVYVGGDAWEPNSRYVAIGLPAMAILLAVLLADLGALVRRGIEAGAAWPAADARRAGNAVTATLYFSAAMTLGPGWDPAKLADYLSLTTDKNLLALYDIAELGLAVQGATAPGAKVLVTEAGALSYYAERNAIDLLGKCDRVIAHQPSHLGQGLERLKSFWPGHTKWDYEYAIGRLEPDLIAQTWWHFEEAEPRLATKYIEVSLDGRWRAYARRDSPYIKWGTLELGPPR